MSATTGRAEADSDTPGDGAEPQRTDTENDGMGSDNARKSPQEPRDGADVDIDLLEPDPDYYEDSRRLLKTLTVGAVVDGKYRVDQVLGRGAMGIVIAATHTELGERVALKFLRIKDPAGGEDFKSRFRREAKVSAKLKSEHVARVIDVGMWREKVPFMVMEYLVGTDLSQIVRENGPLPLDVVLDYAVQICAGIAEAHAHGIVHRDLKTSNIFVTKRTDGTDLIKILDFGISKWHNDPSDNLTRTGVVLGTPKYMAPEQLFKGEEVDSRADIWSIGAILYVLLTGKVPFDFSADMQVYAELASNNMPPSITALREDAPPELEAALFKCFMRKRDERVQDVAELAGALLEAVGSPMADAERRRIAAVLDQSMANRKLSSTSRRLLVTAGSGQHATLTLQPYRRSPTSSTTAGTSHATGASGTFPPQTNVLSRRSLIAVAAVVLAMSGLALLLLFVRGSSEESTQHGPSTNTVVPSETESHADAGSGPTDVTRGTVPTQADLHTTPNGASPSADPGATPTPSAGAVPSSKQLSWGRPTRPPPVPHIKHSADPTPTAPQMSPPSPQPTIAPAPQASSTKKLNPLEDRQ